MSRSTAWHGQGHGWSALRRVIGASCGLVLVVSAGLTGAQASPLGPSDGDGAAKIEADVVDELREEGDATVLVRFEQPDLSAFSEITSWEERGQAVYDALTAAAEDSQAEARALLDEAGVPYESFFISNAILVEGGDRELLTALAGEPDVEGVYLPTAYEDPAPVEEAPVFAPSAVEWNITNVNADDVWSQYGVTGFGITVGSIDTGVDYTHPALVNQYRGNNGDGTFSHDYNWFDAAGSGDAEPMDRHGHGTHTVGTMVGRTTANQIGVAPGARWIAANGCCPSDTALIASGQWMLAPTNRAGTNPRPALRPHVINNSWGSLSASNDPFMEDVSRAWAAAGIFAVFSNGNFGPGCETSGSPGSSVINYSVGAYQSNGTIWPGSSRGAGQHGEIKPNISAPGAGVRSSVPGGGYATYTGTSMAAPHVAGAVALLWSAVPALVGDVSSTALLLDGTASDSLHTGCGGTAMDNNAYGEGKLDVSALVGAAVSGRPIVVRMAGSNRYDSAAKAARQFAPGVETVVIASGSDFPDALAGAARAGSLGGPVLLVRKDLVPQTTRTELLRLQPRNLIIVGGTDAVPTAVANALRAILPKATVTRRAGSNRYETAARIVQDIPSAERVFVAAGHDFPDALAGAALAGSTDAPLLLVRKASLPDAIAAQLTRLAPREIVVLGGAAAVDDEVIDLLQSAVPGVSVTRVAGLNRYDTAAAIAEEWSSATDVYVATGRGWPDALAAAARAGATGSPVLLVSARSVPSETDAALRRMGPRRVVVVGGPTSVSLDIETQLRTIR